jgi:2-polyprenyl-3-methyl-5-hydroxy-6-metoxy-1,4-benzoquinol methylase
MGKETMITDAELTARIEPFDSFWEAPSDIEAGYRSVGRYYEHNYMRFMPADRGARILVVSCGPGYMLEVLRQHGFTRASGIDSSPEKVQLAVKRGLDARTARVFAYLSQNREPFDLIFAEQEINHLTKSEILEFLAACRANLSPGGALLVHSVNGANPLTGSESRAGNFDHYNSFTEHSLKQMFLHARYVDPEAIPLHLYVFFRNPLNYLAWALASLSFVFFRAYYTLLGKAARIYTKKIGAIGYVAKSP